MSLFSLFTIICVAMVNGQESPQLTTKVSSSNGPKQPTTTLEGQTKTSETSSHHKESRFNCTQEQLSVGSGLKKCLYEDTASQAPDGTTEQDDRVRETGDNPSYLSMYTVGKLFYHYSIPTIIGIGIPTNLLSLAVFLRPSARKSPPCIYLATLAVADTLFLGFSLILFVYEQFLQRVMSHWECAILNFLLLGNSLASNWVLMAMSVERMLVTRFPLQAKVWCTPRRARMTCILVWMAAFVWTAPSMAVVRLNPGGLRCSVYSLDGLWSRIYSLASQLMALVIPMVVLLIMNILIIHRLTRRGKSNALAEPSPRVHSKQATETTVQKRGNSTILLLLVSFLFIFSHLFVLVHFLVFTIIDASSSAEMSARFYLVTIVASLVKLSNNAGNFWLYCLGGNRFRRDLAELCHVNCADRNTA